MGTGPTFSTMSPGADPSRRLSRSQGLSLDQGLEGEALGPPAVEAPLEWPDARDPYTLEPKRHPGARRLVGSATVEDDLPVARDVLVAALQLVRMEVERARETRALGAGVDVRPQVDHEHRLPCRHALHQLLGSDPCHPELTEEATALVILRADVADHREPDDGAGAPPQLG